MSTERELEIAIAAIRMHNTWGAMNGRCNNPSDKAYDRYGARGIKVEWKTFEDFFRDMYPTHKIGLSLDRINNNGNYSKANCRWATDKEQANNTRKNRLVSIDGRTMTLTQWCEELGLRVGTVNQRISGYGWDPKVALSKPIEPRGKGVCANGHKFNENTKRADGKGYACKVCRKNNMKVRV